jgi:lipopolysaccharide transport system ATP-binding protein
LAFSVAAHLEPEILIIDEVLAVGDSAFQAQCIDKMTEVARNGRTILFVSHNLGTIKSLCNRGILLNSGKMEMDNEIELVADRYAYGNKKFLDDVKLGDMERKEGEGSLIFDSISFKNKPIKFGEKIAFTVRLNTIKPNNANRDLEFGFVIKDKDFNPVIHISNKFIHKSFDHHSDQDEYYFEIENILKPGKYYMNLFLRSNFIVQDWLKDIINFEILEGNPYGYSNTAAIKGAVYPKFDVKVFSREKIVKS